MVCTVNDMAILGSILTVKKVKASYTRYRALGPELNPVYRQSDHR